MEFNLSPGDFNPDNAIMVNNNLYDIGTRNIRWDDPKGFNGYDTSKVVVEVEDRKTGKVKKKVIKGRRYGSNLFAKRSGGIDAIIQQGIHHTGGYLPKVTFNTLHNTRKLSVTYILSDMGVNYQTLDVVEQSWHMGKHNKTSFGIECCLRPDAKDYPEAYSSRMCVKHGLAPHETMEQYIQGRNRLVFAMPDDQVDALVKISAGTWAALANEKGPLYIANNAAAPLFPSDNKGNINMDYIENSVKHEGLLLHSNASPRKWDAAGIPDIREFEGRVSAMFYEYLKRL